MLGFSLTKLLVLAAIIVAVVYFFKWVGRAQKKRDSLRKRHGDKKTSMDSDGMRNQADLEEMIQCASCDTYLAASDLQNCGKTNCPYS